MKKFKVDYVQDITTLARIMNERDKEGWALLGQPFVFQSFVMLIWTAPPIFVQVSDDLHPLQDGIDVEYEQAQDAAKNE
jgi:hypothetical protein